MLYTFLEQWLSTATIVVAFLVLGLYALSLSRRIKHLSLQHQQQIDRLKSDLNSINSAAIGVGQRLISAEKKLKAAMEQEESRHQPQQPVRPFVNDPLDEAASVAGPEVSAQELVERYGLSEAEANLLSLLKMQGGRQGIAS